MAYGTINPFTEELVKEYQPHTQSEVEEAPGAADAAFRSHWRGVRSGPGSRCSQDCPTF